MRHRHARADHLAVRLGQALAELHAIATDADQAERAWHERTNYDTPSGSVREVTALSQIARAARIAAGSVKE